MTKIGERFKGKDGQRVLIEPDGTERVIAYSQRYNIPKLSNLQFFIDVSHFEWAFGLVNHRKPKWYSGASNHVRKAISEALAGRRIRMEARTLVQIEKETGVPADFLIDEARYYNKNKIAGYRVLFEMYRRGMTLEELTTHPKFTPAHTVWYEYWMRLFKGKLNETTSARYTCAVMENCYTKLGIKPHDLLRPPAKLLNRSVDTSLELFEMMAVLDKTDMAFVAGVVKALCEQKLHDAPLGENIERLLGWYYGRKDSH